MIEKFYLGQVAVPIADAFIPHGDTAFAIPVVVVGNHCALDGRYAPEAGLGPEISSVSLLPPPKSCIYSAKISRTSL